MSWCKNCQNIAFPESRREGGPFIFWGVSYPLSTSAFLQPSAKALQGSSANGCPLCSKFWTALCIDGRRETERILAADVDGQGVVFNIYHEENNAQWPFNGVAEIRCGDTFRYYRPKLPIPDLILSLLARSYNPAPRDPRSKHISSTEVDDHTGSVVNLELAKLWVQECNLTHDKFGGSCTQETPPMLPSRVIDVIHPARPYLLDTQGKRDHYLTLSYCWGKSLRLLTTTQTYVTFRRILPMDEQMPLTFREAFIVTKALGYRYLWIDALCILQDDPADMHKEMARMGEIYMHSVITISAGKGPNADSGLFARRDGKLRKPCNAFVRTFEHGEYQTRPISFVDEQYEYDSPLDDRGWILQEDILARRRLTFTPRDIQWTCKTRKLCEARPYKVRDYGPDGMPDHETVAKRPLNALRLMMTDPGLFNETKDALENPKVHFDVWNTTVSIYSHRSLTIPSDKLPAIGGIAQLMQKNFGYEYGAGLWREDLPQGLCWLVASSGAEEFNRIAAHNEASQPPGQEYIAPSWSWASIRGRGVSQAWRFDNSGGKMLEHCVQIIRWVFTYAPEAVVPFGRLTSGVLTLRGYLRKAFLMPNPFNKKEHGFHQTMWSAFAITTNLRSSLGSVALDTPNIYRYLHGLDLGYELHEFGFPDKLSSGEMPVSCLTTNIWDYNGHRHVYALVLIPDGTKENHYRRIGLLRPRTQSVGSTDSLDVLMSKLSGWITGPRQTIHIV